MGADALLPSRRINDCVFLGGIIEKQLLPAVVFKGTQNPVTFDYSAQPNILTVLCPEYNTFFNVGVSITMD